MGKKITGIKIRREKGGREGGTTRKREPRCEIRKKEGKLGR